jgi:hypothetical protein
MGRQYVRVADHSAGGLPRAIETAASRPPQGEVKSGRSDWLKSLADKTKVSFAQFANQPNNFYKRPPIR